MNPIFKNGDVIDNKYIVTNLCSDKGGMGTIVFVSPIGPHVPYPLVLKYCKSTNSELIQRFIREVRNLATFKGNSKVMQIYAYNIGYQPPYFVMQYFSDGDLTTLCKALKNDTSLQEKIFHGMIDCVNELHTKGLQHRDIKPQNFLRNGDQIIISDLGLSKEIGAGTTFTMSREFWGTQGYLPPEFVTDGFKECDSTSDIFMLGKSFYYLLTERDPLYITSNDIHPAVYHVINKCCEMEKGRRYRTLSDLKQGLTLAYDVILSRANGGGKARQLLAQILDRLTSKNEYISEEIQKFVNMLDSIAYDEQYVIINDLPREFFITVSLQPSSGVLDMFLKCYERFMEPAVHTFSYAEVVANNMKEIFRYGQRPEYKAKALEIAVNGAILANRYAAMDTCREMITSVEDDQLGLLVGTIINSNKDTFVAQIEPAACKNDRVKKAIRELQQPAK